MINSIDIDYFIRVLPLVKVKEDLVYKYEDKLEIQSMTNRISENSHTLDSKKFITLFDKYLMQLLEEIYEAHVEYKKIIEESDDISSLTVKLTIDDLREELVDCISYAFTMICLIKDMGFSIDDLKDINLAEIKNSHPIINHKSASEHFLSAYMELIKIRRMFPQRKWHKPSDEIEVINIEEYSKTIINAFNVCIENIMSIYVNLNSSNLYQVKSEFLNTYSDKNQKIINL